LLGIIPQALKELEEIAELPHREDKLRLVGNPGCHKPTFGMVFETHFW